MLEFDPAPSDAQRVALGELIAEGFCRIRALAGEGVPEEIAQIADAFHNLPIAMFRPEGWSVAWARSSFVQLAQRSRHDYLAEFDRIFPPGSYLEEF